ncbi:DUF5694 domain-containing protein [Novosphingobium sp.]|uniref:DUF5694 domain-containing protein n=1 Tax=Novosphingobium sp. TaxID=1874826 RepID=UPI00261C8D42|nr:DUF5694 domain-containing protein [Novosphingobium sp.]
MAAVAFGTTASAAEPGVDVMVLGAYHFGNPGLDTNNIKVDSVLTPDKQAQLDAVAKALLVFKPTRVMVEMQSTAPDLATTAYAQFKTADLKSDANEITQIGFRIANLAGLKTVEGIDEQSGPGEPDYYPYDKLQDAAAKFGQNNLIDATNEPIKKWLSQFEKDQKTRTVAELLIRVNTDPIYVDMSSYYSWLLVGDNDSQAGADLNAAWYLRNAKIFSKLMHVARPGDRVLVVYGAGHGYWLKHFATSVPGYRYVDPVPYLQRVTGTR